MGRNFTCHDAVLIFKRKSFIKYFRNFSENVKLYPIQGLELYGVFYLVIRDSKILDDLVWKITCKDEIITEIGNDSFDTFINNYPGTIPYEMEIRKIEEVKTSFVFDDDEETE